MNFIIANLRRVLLSILIACLFPLQILSQDADVELLTMEEAIQRALSLNNQLKSSGFSLKQANWDKRRAWTMLFPTLTFNSRYTWIDDSTFALRDFSRYFRDPSSPFQIPQTVYQESYYSSLDFSMPLFNGLLINGLSIASANEDMFIEQNQYLKDNIIFLVISNYLNVIKAKEILKLQQEYLKLSELNWQKAERMYNAGRWSKTDALRWKIEYQQQKSNEVSSKSNMITALSVLSNVLNTDLNQQIKIVQKIPGGLEAEVIRIESMKEDSVYSLIHLSDDELVRVNSALTALKFGEEISMLQYRNSYSAFLPNVTLDYSYAWRENNTIDLDDYSPQTLMINLSLPLFNSFQDYTALKSSYYAYKKNQEDFYDQIKKIRLILTETVNKIVNLKTQMELSNLNVEYNQLNYNTIEKQKEKGLVSNIDFIDSKINVQNSHIENVNNRYDFISSIVELYYLLGTINSIIK